LIGVISLVRMSGFNAWPSTFSLFDDQDDDENGDSTQQQVQSACTTLYWCVYECISKRRKIFHLYLYFILQRDIEMYEHLMCSYTFGTIIWLPNVHIPAWNWLLVLWAIFGQNLTVPEVLCWNVYDWPSKSWTKVCKYLGVIHCKGNFSYFFNIGHLEQG
jgi:hypothetical protein